MNEVGGLGENRLDTTARGIRDTAVEQTKQALLVLVGAIDNKSAGHCLQMISEYCTASLDLLTSLVPGLKPVGKRSFSNLNVMNEGYAVGIGNPMNNNETFGASILTQAVSAIGPMIQSRKVKDIVGALAEAKGAELSEEIIGDLESSLKGALGLDIVPASGELAAQETTEKEED